MDYPSNPFGGIPWTVYRNAGASGAAR